MGRSAYTMPSNVYAALCTVAPSKSSTGSTITEATYTGYARVKVNAADLNAASGGSMTNSADITWPEVQAGSSTVVAVAFCDASSAGNMLVSFIKHRAPQTVLKIVLRPLVEKKKKNTTKYNIRTDRKESKTIKGNQQ